MTAWLLTWLWQGLALAAGVAMALRVAHRLNAATKHSVWYAALAAIAWLGWASSPFPAGTALKGSADLSSTAAEPVLYIPSAPDVLLTVFVGVWAAMALVKLVRLLPGLHAVYALRDRCRPFPPAIEARLPLWLEARARGRRTELMLCDAVPGATVLGLQRPCIAIPTSLLEALTTDDLDQVILHEHAHVQRRDDWSHLAQTLLMSVLWIHPAALCVSRAINREREMACDEWVVARTGLPKVFARCLVHAAEVRDRTRSRSSLVPALVGRRHELVQRVDRLLGLRGKMRRGVSLVYASAAIFSIVTMSAQLHGLRGLEEIAVVALPGVSRPMMSIYGAPATVRLSAAALAIHASLGETRRSRGKGGKPDTTGRDAVFAADVFSVPRPIAPDSAPLAPPAPPALSVRTFTGAYLTPEAPIETRHEPSSPWQSMAAPGVGIASTAKRTGLGIAGVFSRAGVSLARSF